MALTNNAVPEKADITGTRGSNCIDYLGGDFARRCWLVTSFLENIFGLD